MMLEIQPLKKIFQSAALVEYRIEMLPRLSTSAKVNELNTPQYKNHLLYYNQEIAYFQLFTTAGNSL